MENKDYYYLYYFLYYYEIKIINYFCRTSIFKKQITYFWLKDERLIVV